MTVAAHWTIRCFPTGVEPVNVTLRTIGFDVISSPISPVFPETTLITPAGTPARSARTAMAVADKGVAFAGLHTTVHPAPSAGPNFLPSIALGKFQGVIQPTTPIPSFITTILLSLEGEGMVSP
ncbi:MAG: Uncharacterised protein [Chloroflexota bacterium]|nr:MAG: Uncharacterised protein [Chloroflexota bacterium]